MIYLTGDTHGDFSRVEAFCKRFATTVNDTLIILGDAGINYFGDIEDVDSDFPLPKDRERKRMLSQLPITLLCVHGNHEQRPESIDTYKETDRYDGKVYWEPEFPNLLFTKDGEIYQLNGKRCIAVGGAYSVDKHYRLMEGMGWWPDEQPSDEIKKRVEQRLVTENWMLDAVLSHTCPYKYIPRETFLTFINQRTVDNSTEKWLDTIEERLDYSIWYCGHFHTDKVIDDMRFLFTGFMEC